VIRPGEAEAAGSAVSESCSQEEGSTPGPATDRGQRSEETLGKTRTRDTVCRDGSRKVKGPTVLSHRPKSGNLEDQELRNGDGNDPCATFVQRGGLKAGLAGLRGDTIQGQNRIMLVLYKYSNPSTSFQPTIQRLERASFVPMVASRHRPRPRNLERVLIFSSRAACTPQPPVRRQRLGNGQAAEVVEKTIDLLQLFCL
jgi:hypothetical protein